MRKDVITCLTLEQVSKAQDTVDYLPHGVPGGWQRYVEFVQQRFNVTSFEGWSVSDFFRTIISFLLDGKNSPPFVCSQMFENLDDDTPAYKISVFDVSYDQLDAFDRNIQPSWFTVQITPRGGLYTVALTPKRSLMKLIYKNLM